MLKKTYIIFIYVIITGYICSCAGYRVRKRVNPWQQYGIKHVTVPLFVNDTMFPGLNSVVTAKIIEELGGYLYLQVSAGENNQADALLLGILTGPNKMHDALKTTEQQYLNDEYSASLGERRGIYVPRKQTYVVNLQLILIKNPTTFEKELARSNLRKYLQRSSKIIFNRSLVVNQQVIRKIWTRESSDDGGVVNYTQNEGVLRRSYKSVADNLTKQFRELVLYAF